MFILTCFGLMFPQLFCHINVWHSVLLSAFLAQAAHADKQACCRRNCCQCTWWHHLSGRQREQHGCGVRCCVSSCTQKAFREVRRWAGEILHSAYIWLPHCLFHCSVCNIVRMFSTCGYNQVSDCAWHFALQGSKCMLPVLMRSSTTKAILSLDLAMQGTELMAHCNKVVLLPLSCTVAHCAKDNPAAVKTRLAWMPSCITQIACSLLLYQLVPPVLIAPGMVLWNMLCELQVMLSSAMSWFPALPPDLSQAKS